MAARVLSCAFWLQRLSLLRWFTITMAQHVFACAAHRFLRDGISGLRLPDTAVDPRFSLWRTSRETGGYACTSAPEGWGLHPHEDGVTRPCGLAACLEVLTSFQPTGHRSQFVAHKYWGRCCASPRRFSAHLLEIGESQRCLLASMPPTFDLLQSAIN